MRKLKAVSFVLGVTLFASSFSTTFASDEESNKLKRPTNLSANALSSTSILVNFNSVPRATSYTVKVFSIDREHLFKSKIVISAPGAMISTTINDLAARTTYKVSVFANALKPYKNSEETEKIRVTTLLAGITPTIGDPTQTADGFIVTISNYSVACTYSQSLSSGSGSINRVASTVTVSGLYPGESRTITVIQTCPGYDSGTFTSGAISALPLTPAFGTYTSTSNGFTVQITNFRSDYNWAATSGIGDATVSGSGLVTVTGLSAGTFTSVHVSTSRANCATGSADSNSTYSLASSKTISTSSTIANGAVNPSIIVTGVDFKSGITGTDLTIVANSTNLSCSSVTFNSPTQITIFCSGTANAGALLISANPSAFAIVPGSSSNTLSVVVPTGIVPALSSNSSLSDLLISSGTLNPIFSSATHTYSVVVPYSVPEVTVTPTLSESSSSVTVNNILTSSGLASGAISIFTAKTVVQIIVSAPDTSTTTYTVNIYRGPRFFFLTTNNNSYEIVANRSVPVESYKIISNAVVASSYSIDKALPTGLIFDTSTGMISGTPSVNQVRNFWTVTLHNAIGPDLTALFYLTVKGVSCDGSVSICQAGDRGPGNGIIYYVAPTPFASPGSTCNTNGLGGNSTCRYLEYAPAGWLLNDNVPVADSKLSWSANVNTLTGQNFNLTTIQSGFPHESDDWAIGAGFNNSTLIANQAGSGNAATNAAIAALSYAASDGSVGKWFLPSANELNEMCKYANGYATGVLMQLCQGGSFNDQLQDLGGFIYDLYWSSSETNNQYQSVAQDFYGFNNQFLRPKTDTYLVRPIRVF